LTSNIILENFACKLRALWELSGSSLGVLWELFGSSLQLRVFYYSNPNCPDISEIEDVSRYVVSYTGKRHNMSQAEIDYSKYHHEVSKNMA
jgi:hypothetical protein